MEKLKLEEVKKELASKSALTLQQQSEVKGGLSCYNGGGTSGNSRRPYLG